MLVLYVLFAILGVIAAFFLFLTICWLTISPKKYYEKDSLFYRSILNMCSVVAMKVARIHIHVSGEEKLPRDRKLLFVGNHVSNFDPIITWYIFRKWKIAFISKDANFKIPWFGRFIRRCCFMDIDRENPRNAIVTINRAAGLLRKQEVSIGVYPEGTRSKSGEMLPFHNGVFKIAQKAEADIAVVSLNGTGKVAKNFPFHSTEVFLDVLEVIPAQEIHQAKTEHIGKRVEEALKENKRRREEDEKGVCAV